MNPGLPQLSKSRFLSGLQCHKRLYLECFQRELADPIDAGAQARFDAGSAVGALARRRFPGGVLLDEDHLHHDDAVARTRDLLADPAVPSLYEAAFTHDDIRVRADVLARTPGGALDLIEVKSAASVKEQYLWDVAVQRHVLEGAGAPIGRACLLHLNRDYIYRGGEYALDRLFTLVDLTDLVKERAEAIVDALEAMRASLRTGEAPPIETGPHCTTPYTCPFYGHCHRDEPEHPIDDLPRVRPKLRRKLELAGIRAIPEIPRDFEGLSQLQQRALDAIRAGNRFHDPEIARELAAVEYPVHFVDFETFMPALPRFPGTRPYQVIPFQWSDHVLGRDGSLTHREFLHDGTGDPRRAFATSLLEAVAAGGSIVVYSGYESQRLADLAIELPDLARELAAVRARIFDLLPPIQRHVYDPAFRGSFSIKSVLPAIVPALDYDDLEISGGQLASVAYEESLSPTTPPERVANIRAALLAYCRRDTEAMLELFRVLR